MKARASLSVAFKKPLFSRIKGKLFKAKHELYSHGYTIVL